MGATNSRISHILPSVEAGNDKSQDESLSECRSKSLSALPLQA